MGEIVALRTESLPRKLSATVLTDKVIERLAAGERAFDAKERGLYVRRGKNGVSYRAMADLPKRSRPIGSRTVELTIGHWPDLSVAKARAAAKLMIGQVKSGIDPRRPRIEAND